MARDFSSVERFIDRIVEQGGVNGAGIAFGVQGEPVFEYFQGEAAPGMAASGEALWPLASITKSYTAAAIMSLVEEGRLGMWSLPSVVFPEFRGDGREEIRLRHLLTHTSGLTMGPANGAELEAAEASVEELVAHAYTDPLLFPPGTGQSYSDTGYALAGLMAAKVAGVSYPELIRTRVLEPAGLTETFVQLPAEHLPRVARIEGAPGTEMAMESYSSAYGTRLGHPSYSALATVSDLLRFVLQFDPHAEERFLSKAAVRTMSTDQTGSYHGTAEGFPISKWGAGFQLQSGWGSTGLGSRESYGHMGGTGCIGWIDPVDAVSVAFVSNQHYSAVPEGLGWKEVAANVAFAAMTAPVASEQRVGFRE
jgi:CubicO group peptidase (beta-lactamase class C family)